MDYPSGCCVHNQVRGRTCLRRTAAGRVPLLLLRLRLIESASFLRTLEGQASDTTHCPQSPCWWPSFTRLVVFSHRAVQAPGAACIAFCTRFTTSDQGVGPWCIAKTVLT